MGRSARLTRYARGARPKRPPQEDNQTEDSPSPGPRGGLCATPDRRLMTKLLRVARGTRVRVRDGQHLGYRLDDARHGGCRDIGLP